MVFVSPVHVVAYCCGLEPSTQSNTLASANPRLACVSGEVNKNLRGNYPRLAGELLQKGSPSALDNSGGTLIPPLEFKEGREACASISR
jgi:hypothetical protein